MKVPALKEVQYDASVFMNVETVDDAVSIILTPEAGMTSRNRWNKETPYLMELMRPFIADRNYVLDYGCGIGRLAKPLIQMWHCTVVGVDISPNMRALATSCVESDQFFALSPDMLWHITPRMFDAAIAIWTLQHCLELKKEIERIRDMLKPGGCLFVVNNTQRVVPTNVGRWIDDGLKVEAEILQNGFAPLASGELQREDIAPEAFRKFTFWAAYRKE